MRRPGVAPYQHIVSLYPLINPAVESTLSFDNPLALSPPADKLGENGHF